MTNLELLMALGGISAEHLSGAEALQSRPPVRQVRKTGVKKAVLFAAAMALAALLVGCAVVYVLSLSGIKLGDREVPYGDAHRQEHYTQQVLTLAGLQGTSAHQAAREWYEFLKSYDPDRAIAKNALGLQEIPAQYRCYGVYTQQMQDKLEQLLAKYDLALRGELVEFQTTKLLFRALGMENVLNPGSQATMDIGSAYYYENGNLDLSFSVTVPGAEGSQTTRGDLFYRSKNCLIPDTAVLTDAVWEEWTYTTASGHQVLIIRSDEAGTAWIFCDMPSHTASLRLDALQRAYEQVEDGVPVFKWDTLTRQQLEQIADAIDFSLEPRLVEGWQTLSDDAVPANQEINGYRIEPVSAFTDGYSYQIVLRITAPEGVALTDPEDYTATVEPLNGSQGICREDGDGKLNTCLYILSDSVYYQGMVPEDGSFPYPQGNVVPVRIQDLYLSRFDFAQNKFIRTLLTEGTWTFNIPLSNADTRQFELLTQPITAKGRTAYNSERCEDVLEELRITSIRLHALGIDVTSENSSAQFFSFVGQHASIVMKDGSQVAFTWNMLDSRVDLDQVAYVQLADRTILPMPGVDEDQVRLLSAVIQAEAEAAYVPLPVFEGGIELLTEPIIMQHLAGYASDASGDVDPIYEGLRISSIILHPQGLAIVGPAAFDSTDTQATVVLDDGSQILLSGIGGAPYCDEPLSQLASPSTIDLDKVDHLILPDGTRLSVPHS